MRQTYGFLSVLGWLGGIGVILFGIVFDADTGIVWENLKNFYDAPSIAVVLGGVIVALMVSFPIQYFQENSAASEDHSFSHQVCAAGLYFTDCRACY